MVEVFTPNRLLKINITAHVWNIRWLRNTSAKCLVSFCGENGEKLVFSKRNEKKKLGVPTKSHRK